MYKTTQQQVPARQVTFACNLGLYDATMIGVGAMICKIPEQIARYSRTPVILVKHHEGARTWLNRFLGS